MVIKTLLKTLPSGQSSLSFTDEECDDSMIYDVFVESLDLFPTNVSVTGHTVTVNFKDAAIGDMNVKIVVNALDGSLDGSDIPYDNTDTSLTSDNVEDAIDELDNNISQNVGDIEQLQLDVVAAQSDITDLQTAIQNLDASHIAFDNTLSGMISDDVQGAIEEAYNHGGGGGVNYSTEEQVIGTWIDGKPIYKKCFSIATATMLNSIITLNLDVNDIKVLIKTECNMLYDNDNRWLSLPYLRPTENESIYLLCLRNNTNNVISQIFSRGANYNNKTFSNITVTLEYTKTTD